MGNSAYKREQAKRFNENREYQKEQERLRIEDMLANPEKYSRKLKRARRARSLGLGYGDNVVMSKEPPTLIKDWEELAAVPDTEKYRLDITPEDGSGWIKEKSTGDTAEYLSTHTFYGLNYEYSTRLLQKYGFNVTIDNWDK